MYIHTHTLPFGTANCKNFLTFLLQHFIHRLLNLFWVECKFECINNNMNTILPNVVRLQRSSLLVTSLLAFGACIAIRELLLFLLSAYVVALLVLYSIRCKLSKQKKCVLPFTLATFDGNRTNTIGVTSLIVNWCCTQIRVRETLEIKVSH